MKKPLLRLLLILFPAFASYTVAGQELYLIPAPRNVDVRPGQFVFGSEVRIFDNGLKNIGLEDLKDILLTELGIPAILPKNGTKQAIRFEKRDDPSFRGNAEAYRLEVGPGEIRVTGPTEAGIFYGVQTLTQLITANRTGRAVPCLVITDYPDIPIRGWQDDISRGPIPTLEFMKKEVRTLAAFKLNAMTLYTEHVFKLKRHPTLAPDDGITQEQIAELSEYAAKYHVQVIGNFQSFGHMEKILSKPGYEHLAESGHILTPTKEESYTFMKEIYSEIVPAYSSPYFNINCDETFGLGETLSKKMADTMGIEGIYGYHINRLNDLLKPYNKRILMWGDIAANPKIAARLPRDITVISWGYHDAASFDYAIKPFSDQHLNFWVAPGVSCWGNVFPNLKVAEVNISNYIRDGYRLGATGVLNTCWTDDGLNLFENNWYGLVWGAECSWRASPPAPSPALPAVAGEGVTLPQKERFGEAVPAFAGMTKEAFGKAFDKIFFGTKTVSVVDWMQALSSLHQDKVRAIATNGRIFETVLPFYPEYVNGVQITLNNSVIHKVDSLRQLLPELRREAVRNGIDLRYLEYAISAIRFSAEKNVFRVNLYRHLQEGSGGQADSGILAGLDILVKEAARLKSGYEELWRLTNRNWWLDRNMEKFGKLREDLLNVRGLTILTFGDTLTAAGRSLTMRSMLGNMPVFFTLDGSVPTVQSQRYAGPVTLTGDATIRARVIDGGREYPEAADSLIMHKAIGRLYRLNSHWSTYHPAYDAGGRLGLLDGRTGSVKDIRSGRWQGYSGQDISVEIDFGKKETLHTLSMGFYQHTFSWVILPKQLDIFASDDGVTYRKLKSLTHDIPVNYPDPVVHRFETGLDGIQARFLRVVGVYYGPLPAWHGSAGQESMMFADEITIL